MIIVNGKRYEAPAGASVTIINGRVIINGRTVEEGLSEVVTLKVEGDLVALRVDGPVELTGNVHGPVSAGGSVECGDVGGSVQAGGSVRCGAVRGGVMAAGSVRHG